MSSTWTSKTWKLAFDNQEDIVMFSGKSIEEACEDYLTINPVVTEMLKNSK